MDKLRSRSENDMGMMACPVWAVMVSGRVDTLWLTAEEAQQHIDHHAYRLPGATVYGYGARGQLKKLLDSVTDEEVK